jgi:2-polyprenyl-3-methyl-5-hydroxy-6-metoxy-1,4-benzoquinol methylase
MGLTGACCGDESTKWISAHFDSRAQDHCEEYQRNGLSASSILLMRRLVDDGLSGRTILDLGCGSGIFSIEALKNGASSSVGVDLSPIMIATANKLASDKGFAMKAKFMVGDAAKQDHHLSDIVILDKVVCCYPSIEGLLSKASTACRERLGLIVPRDVGFAKVPVRIGVYVDNIIDRIRKNPVRMYLHSLDRIDAFLRRSGLQRKIGTVSGFWFVLIYERW